MIKTSHHYLRGTTCSSLTFAVQLLPSCSTASLWVHLLCSISFHTIAWEPSSFSSRLCFIFSKWGGLSFAKSSQDTESVTVGHFMEASCPCYPNPAIASQCIPTRSCCRRPRHVYEQSPAKAACFKMTQELILGKSNCNSQSNSLHKIAWK